MNPLSVLSLALLVAGGVGPALAQEPEQAADATPAVVENIRYDYAQVLNVEPVFQVLRASRTEEQCEPVSTRTLDPVNVVVEEEERGGLGRLWSSVKRIFGSDESRPRRGAEGEVVRRDPLLTRNCRIVEVGREFRRPIAYDVDYVYRGTKYRSRLPEDPGNRLRIRVSVTPLLGPAAQAQAEAN